MSVKLLGCLLLIAPCLAVAQGTVYFSTIQIRDPADSLPLVNAPIYVGAVGGERCDDNYYLALFGGNAGAAGANLSGGKGSEMTCGRRVLNGPQVVFSFLNGSKAGYLFAGANMVLPGVGVGELASVQVRAWSKSLGSDWNAAYALWMGGNGLLGASRVMDLTLGNPMSLLQPRLGSDVDPAYARFSSSPGMTPFAVVAFNDALGAPAGEVPEPGVLALAGAGLFGALMIRRHK